MATARLNGARDPPGFYSALLVSSGTTSSLKYDFTPKQQRSKTKTPKCGRTQALLAQQKVARALIGLLRRQFNWTSLDANSVSSCTAPAAVEPPTLPSTRTRTLLQAGGRSEPQLFTRIVRPRALLYVCMSASGKEPYGWIHGKIRSHRHLGLLHLRRKQQQQQQQVSSK